MGVSQNKVFAPGKVLRLGPNSPQSSTCLVATLPQMPQAHPCPGPPAGLPGSASSLRGACTSQISRGREESLVVLISLMIQAWLSSPGGYV